MSHVVMCGGHRITLDQEGFLKSLDDWNPAVADMLARHENIVLSEAHWEIIRLLRQFHREHSLSPPMRPLVNLVKRELGPEKGRSIYLMKLFGGNSARTANKIAGLPRPSNCI